MVTYLPHGPSLGPPFFQSIGLSLILPFFLTDEKNPLTDLTGTVRSKFSRVDDVDIGRDGVGLDKGNKTKMTRKRLSTVIRKPPIQILHPPAVAATMPPSSCPVRPLGEPGDSLESERSAVSLAPAQWFERERSESLGPDYQREASSSFGT
ncbi:hypothetical protein GALMADRAFT_215188 [Galerina marginata CBS 339.88]|uniref:Uncharacterized protein n=1 Tax=Galerina marginata (strain CBS 339.88) TaxID=685588 RepID=A0A067SPD5_GALM3|nr:hypothetical protein GALMADRAFT_215188 [Galerina marginata CBS 339.88]